MMMSSRTRVGSAVGFRRLALDLSVCLWLFLAGFFSHVGCLSLVECFFGLRLDFTVGSSMERVGLLSSDRSRSRRARYESALAFRGFRRGARSALVEFLRPTPCRRRRRWRLWVVMVPSPLRTWTSSRVRPLPPELLKRLA
uniref:(northern house mosquito) hypothetical protein n=1 Tax=Culex pipiens TaxID=7175 RepID=A0A8D8P3M9_CULPI